MAETHVSRYPTVIRDLQANPQKFSFNQLIRLLRLWTKKEKLGGWQDFLRKRVRFRPTLSLGFAVTDVEDFEMEPALAGDDSHPFASARITASFLGLYGPSSPLPTFYTERLLDEQAEDRSVTRDFLDIFNTVFFLRFIRLSSIIFPLQRGLMEKDKKAMHMLMSLASFGNDELCGRLADEPAFLRYAGLFCQNVRSAAGLRTIMADAVGNDNVQIHCNVPRLAPVPAEQRLRLGQAACTLGEDAVLGDAVPCYEGKIVIEFTQLDKAALRRILPGAPLTGLLHDLVRNYCREPLEYEAVLRLQPGAALPLCLGGDGERGFATIGHDAWTGWGWLEPSAPLPSATACFPAGFNDRSDLFLLTNEA
ncbi:MAG: type VI secretion system baseplate subunit TssG [Deltaproteobacteria bacterium]|jgi:type VI secretion system protein ImpH|nr:type VI secretion system baseplate subunit TssG [Deltaproteobacteria bacterium]